MDDTETLEKIAKAITSIEQDPPDILVKHYGLIRMGIDKQKSKCPHCGSNVKRGSKFCDHCWEMI